LSDWVAALLGLVQGLSEFLPISSSGHLVMAEELLGVNSPGILFEIAVHVATLVSVLVFYRGRILELLRGALAGSRKAWSYVGKLALATLPAVVAALLALDFFESLFEAPVVAGVGLLAAGGVVFGLVALVFTTRDPAIDPGAGYLGALLLGLMLGLWTSSLFWLAVFARHGRIAYRGDWLRAARRGLWVGLVVGLLVELRVVGVFSLPIALFIVVLVLFAELTLSIER